MVSINFFNNLASGSRILFTANMLLQCSNDALFAFYILSIYLLLLPCRLGCMMRA